VMVVLIIFESVQTCGSLHNFNNTSQASSSFTISSLPTMVTVSVMLLHHMAKSECKQFNLMRNAQLAPTILIDTLNTLNNHISIAATALNAPQLKVETFDGIKSLNCWSCIPPLYLYAWDSTSTGGPPNKVFEIPRHIIDTMPVLF